MKKFAFFTILVLLSCPAAAQHSASTPLKHKSEFTKERPKPNDQMRLERRSEAYKKSVSQAAADPDNSLESGCYYTMSGCDDEVASKNQSLISNERKPSPYPKPGHLLGDDGYYHFKSNAMSRN